MYLCTSLKSSLSSADSVHMAQTESVRGNLLTPEQARTAHRWMRLLVIAGVLQAWTVLALVGLFVPHLPVLLLGLGVLYSMAAPLLLRYLDRDVDRRVFAEGAQAGARQDIAAVS